MISRIQAEEVTPDRFLIIGGVVAGVELIYSIYEFFTSDGEKEIDFYSESGDTNIIKEMGSDELKKYEQLTVLLGRSRLYDVINGTTNQNEELELLMQEIIKQEPRRVSKGILTEDDISPVQIRTQKKAVFDDASSRKIITTNVSTKGLYDVSPFEAEHEFHYKITNKITGGVTAKSSINYYEVGKAYFAAEKKSQAKEYFFRCVRLSIDRINKAKAILFLEKNYNMTIGDIFNQARKYRKRE